MAMVKAYSPMGNCTATLSVTSTVGSVALRLSVSVLTGSFIGALDLI